MADTDYKTLWDQTVGNNTNVPNSTWGTNYGLNNIVNSTTIPTPTTVVDPNTEIVNTGRTLQTVRQEAEAEYLARSAQQRYLGLQGIVAGGQDRYQQARMAMEQQQALSDTRGLTAGAAEGARQGLSATQQVALNQIEANTLSQINDLKAQGIQDEFLAQEYGLRQVDIFKQTSPEYGEIELLSGQMERAYALGDTERAAEIEKELVTKQAQFLGLDPEIYSNLTDPGASAPQVRASTQKFIDSISKDPSGVDKTWAVLGVAGGLALAIAGALASPITGGASLVATGTGIKMMAAGAVALSIGGTVGFFEARQELSPQEKKARIDRRLAEDRKLLIENGYTAEEADAAIAEAKKPLPPIYQ